MFLSRFIKPVIVSLALIAGFLLLNPPVSQAYENLVLLGSGVSETPLELIGEGAEFEQTIDGVKISAPGEFYLVYPNEFSNEDYNNLRLILSSNKPSEITVISNISTTGDYTFELQEQLVPISDTQTLDISLTHKLFGHVSDWGIKFVSTQNLEEPLEIVFQEISLSKKTKGQVLGQGFVDFWQVAPYSPFTANLLPTPLVFGRPAFVYFLPVFFALVILLVVSSKYRKLAVFGLLAIWLLFSLRMSYEFIKYHNQDLKTWVQPEQIDKSFRTYGNFYGFVNWLSDNLPADTQAIKLIAESDNIHLPRLFKYYLYPVKIKGLNDTADIWVIYNRRGLQHDSEDSKLYLGQEAISSAGKVINRFNESAFIFQINK